MAEFVGAAAIEVGKRSVEPIKRQFNYLCCFNTNIRNLSDEAKKLDDVKVGVEGQVYAARRNIEVIVPQVETWLDDVNKIQANMSAIEPEILNVKNNCVAIMSRFSLSRKAMKMAEAMKVLQDKAMFGQISHPPPPAAMRSIPHGQTCYLQSRIQFEEGIMATLREKKVNLIGICGMGGVGKTTMAKQIMSKARREGLFAEIVMAVVSQPVDMLRIQKEIAEYLGLRLDVESLPTRAHLLHTRIMSTKNILIILDDLWEGLNLEDLGIPDQRELKECTILLTSRNKDVFIAMNVEKCFQIKTLETEEAWTLFKNKVGACADDQSLFPAAQQIVRECNGLPIALVTVGVALKDKTDKFIWEDAAQELRSFNPRDIPHFLAQVYSPLKLSYDLLESEHAKSMLLLCCLFPEDYEIFISNLSLYVLGLGMFKEITSLQVARNKVKTLVEMLKSRSLLLDCRFDGFTKMHDIVRDVGIFIAAKEGLMDPNIGWNIWPREESNCTWISLFGAEKTMLSEGSVFPNLRFLLIEGRHSMSKTISIDLPLPDSFFEKARYLSVLSIKHYLFRSLPHTIQLQKNLRTLILCNCEYLEDISVVSGLVSLEILYCHDCGSIKNLPEEIGRLNHLKLLDFSRCWNLKTITRGVISRLIKLEELTFNESFKKWEWGGSEGKNATLCELNSLSSLTTLRIQIEDASLAAEQIHLSQNLVEFYIQIGFRGENLYVSRYRYGRDMRLDLERDVVIGDWIQQLLRITERLYLEGEGSSKLLPLFSEFQSLKRLKISKNAKMIRLIDSRPSGTTTFLPLLECLELWNIVDLEEIQNGPIALDSFNNLQELSLVSLPKLQHLGNNYLLQLKVLEIRSCSMLEQVVSWSVEENLQSSLDHHRRITFPKLEELYLADLPRLTSFCRGTHIIEFPLLTEIDIEKCPNLKNLVSSPHNDHNKCPGATKHEDDDDSLHLFCKSKVVFGRLENLRINGYESISGKISRLWCDQISADFFSRLVKLAVSNCDNIKSLFSISIARNLVNNLENIEIKSCPMLEQVVLWSEEENETISCLTFPKLKGLYVYDLPRLTSFCKGIQNIEFPRLTNMVIVNCPNLKSLPSSMENDLKKCRDANSLHLVCRPEQVAFGRLEYLNMDGYENISRLWCDIIPVDFFNGLVNLSVSNCGNIKSLFSFSIVRSLVNLRVLCIRSCLEMLKVIEGKVDEAGRSPFIKLEVLTLEELPMLKSFCDWSCAFELPSLRNVLISKCPLMERFPFGILTSPISFKNLESIEVRSCSMLEEVMVWNGEETGKDIDRQSSRDHRRITFPKLKRLCLHDLSRLTSFCKGIQSNTGFPLLTEMEILKCPNLKEYSFFNRE